MTDSKKKIPTKKGLQRVRAGLKEIYKKPPTDELMKAINESGGRLAKPPKIR